MIGWPHRLATDPTGPPVLPRPEWTSKKPLTDPQKYSVAPFVSSGFYSVAPFVSPNASKIEPAYQVQTSTQYTPRTIRFCPSALDKLNSFPFPVRISLHC